jgi:hypothetical protein
LSLYALMQPDVSSRREEERRRGGEGVDMDMAI